MDRMISLQQGKSSLDETLLKFADMFSLRRPHLFRQGGKDGAAGDITKSKISEILRSVQDVSDTLPEAFFRRDTMRLPIF